MYWLGVWFIHMFGISKYAERASHPMDADCSCQRIFQIFGLWNLFSSFDAKDHLVVLHKGSRINSNLNAFKPHVCQCFMNHNSPFKIIISHGTNEAYKIAVSPLPKDKRSARVSLVEIVPKCFKHANPRASIAKMSQKKKVWTIFIRKLWNLVLVYNGQGVTPSSNYSSPTAMLTRFCSVKMHYMVSKYLPKIQDMMWYVRQAQKRKYQTACSRIHWRGLQGSSTSSSLPVCRPYVIQEGHARHLRDSQVGLAKAWFYRGDLSSRWRHYLP